MKKVKLSTLFFGLLLFLSGCERPGKDGGEWFIYKDYLIDGYISVTELNAEISGGLCHLSFDGHKVSKSSQDPLDVAEFNRLSQLHGGWLGKVVGFSDAWFRSEYFCYDDQIVSIDVSSDVAWNNAHPAGSSLNDICVVATLSAAEFIRNNNSGITLREVVRPLNKLNEGDLDMIIDGFTRFYFTTSPTVSSKRTIFYKTHMKSGRVFTAQIIQ